MSLAIDVEQITAIVLTNGLRYEVSPGDTSSLDAFELLDSFHSPGRWIVRFQPEGRATGFEFVTPGGTRIALPAEHIMVVEYNDKLHSQRND